MTIHQTASAEPYNAKYYYDKYDGDTKKVYAEYGEAIEANCQERYEYRTTPRKGGRFRRERMAELERRFQELNSECFRIVLAIGRYRRENGLITTATASKL